MRRRARDAWAVRPAWRSAIFGLFIASACSGGAGAGETPGQTVALPGPDGHLFTKLPPGYTGVRFENGYQSAGLAHILEFVMQHQNAFALPQNLGGKDCSRSQRLRKRKALQPSP